MKGAVTGFSFLIALTASAGVFYSARELRAAAEQIDRLEGRLARLESAVTVPTESSPSASNESSTGTDSPRPSTLGQTIDEVERLRTELDEVKEDRKALVAASEKGAKTGGPVDPEEVKRAVEEILQTREVARQEADKKRMAEMAKARLEKTIADLSSKLELSAQQQTLVAEILTRSSNAQQELWSNRKEGENPWQKTQELRKTTDDAIKQHLTVEQQVKYEEYMKANYGGPRMVIESTKDGGTVIQGGGGR